MDNALLSASTISPTAEEGKTGLWHNSLLGYGLIVAAVAVGQVSLFYQPKLGAYLTAAALALLMGIAAQSSANRKLALTAALIPLLSMINLSIVQQSAFEQTAILYSSMLVLALAYRIIMAPATTPVPSHLSLRGYLGSLPLMAITGALLGLLGYKLLTSSYIFGGIRLWQVIAVAIIGACAEEALFRGLIQRQATQLMRPVYAATITSLLFLTLSFSHFTAWSLLVGALSTAILSTVYVIKPNLILTTTLNLASKLVYVGLVAKYLLG
jgi:membrane protease YdiL (CAAX protease family)